MNKTSKELREQRKEVKDKIESLTSKVKTEGREFTDSEARELQENLDLEERYDRDIVLALSLEKRAVSSVAGATVVDAEKREASQFSFGKLMREITEGRGSEAKITGIERELIEESAKEKRELGSLGDGLYLSNKFLQVETEKRTMSTGTPTAGGNFIATEKIGFFDALYARTVLSDLGATKLTGLSSNADLTGFSAGVVAGWALETADAASGDPTTASKAITPKRLTAYVDMSKLLLIQDNQSITTNTLNSFMRSFATAIEAGAINGSGGSGQPTGLLGTSGIGNVAMGTNGAAPTLAKILELIQVVETANAGINGKFLINPKVKAKLMQTVIDAGSGAMIMSYMNYFLGQPDQIASRPTYSTTNNPSNLVKGTSGAVCSSIIYGDWENLVVGQFGGIDLTIDPISQSIGGKTRIVMSQYVGVAVKQQTAFGAILDALTT